MTDPKTRRKKLYDILIKDEAFHGSIEEFETKFSDSKRLSKLYKTLSDNEYYSGTEDDFNTKFFDDLIKKKSALPPISDQLGYGANATFTESGKPSVAETPAPAAEDKPVEKPVEKQNPFVRDSFIEGELKKIRQEKPQKDAAAQAERKQKLSEYYDKISNVFDAQGGDASRLAYKNWSAESGTMDRYNYLEQKAHAEALDKRQDLALATTGIKQLQADRRKAASAGDMEEYSRLNALLQSGVEYLRANKHAANSNWQSDPRTETGLRLWEESVGFTSEMLNAKMEKLLSNPDTNQKISRLVAIGEEIKKKPDNSALVEEHNKLITEPDIAEINKLSKHGEALVNTEKELAIKFPDVFRKRLDKKEKQAGIDAMFQGMEGVPGLGLASGVVGEVDRSAIGFLASIAKLPAMFDYDNQYAWEDKWNGTIDAAVDYVNQEYFPVPSDYSKPLRYEDEKGNTVFRTDLILPKVAKVGGDMAALLFGAGKISALGKAAGLSNKVSQGIGLYTSSYIQSYDDYKKSGDAAGMNPSDAAWFANAAAATTSALELISPNKYLWTKAADDVAKSVAKNITSGMSRKAALSSAFKSTAKEVLGENIQETSQQLGDGLIESGANVLAGNTYFEHNAKDVINESIETMVLTTIVSGVPAGGASTIDFANRKQNYRDAINIVAENKDKYLPLLQKSFKETGASPEEVRQVMDDINATVVPINAAPLYKLDGQTVERSVIEERIANEEFDGIYVANDKPLEQQLRKAFDAVSAPTSQAVTTSLAFLKGIPKAGIQNQVNRLVESGDVAIEGDQVIARTPKGIKELKGVLRNASNYLKGIPKVTAQKAGEEETPEDKAKRIAEGEINALVATGDLKYDGTRVTALTEKGQQELATILNKMARSQAGVVTPTQPEEKIEQEDVDQKAGAVVPRPNATPVAGIDSALQPVMDTLVKGNKIERDGDGNITTVKQNSGYPSQLYEDLKQITGDQNAALNEYLKIKDDAGEFKKKYGDWENQIMKNFGRSGLEYTVKTGASKDADPNAFVWTRNDEKGNPIITFNPKKVRRESDFTEVKKQFKQQVVSKEKGTKEQKEEYKKLYESVLTKLRDLKLHLIHEQLINKQNGAVTIEDKINSIKEIQRLNSIDLAKDYYGEPMLFMHGGKAGIEKFLKPGDKGYVAEDPMTGSAGIYFNRAPKAIAHGYAKIGADKQPAKGKDVYYVFLRTKNPYYMSDPRAQKDYPISDSQTIYKRDVDALKKKGYDSIIWDKENVPKKEAIVFEPEQVEIIGSYRDGLRNAAPKQQTTTEKVGTDTPADQPQQKTKAQETKTDTAEKTNDTVENEESDRINRVLRKVKRSLKSLVPDLRIEVYNGLEEGKKISKKATDKTAGFYDADQKLIGIDLSKADSTTAFHEGFHPIIEVIKAERPEVFKNLTEQAAMMPVKLEDGSYVPYGEYTEGNKEEALVEVLADYADGKFDNDKSIIQKIKDFIRSILDAIGLKASDFKIDLNNIEDLKDFADGLSEAISSGRKINFKQKVAKATGSGVKFQNLGAKRKFRKFEKDTGRKVNKTAKRVAYDKHTKDKALQVDIINDPKAYSYLPQDFKEIEKYLEARTDIELYQMLDANNSMAVLAGIKLMDRYRKAGQDTRPIFKKLRELGTGVGQLLRQFGELKTNTPEGIVEMVDGNLESLSVQLTDPQRTELETLASDHIKALNDVKAKRTAFTDNPNPKTEKEFDEAEDNLAKTFEKLNTFIGKVTPVGLDSIIPLILQGNLLTSKSIVTNTIGNLIQMPFRQTELLAGDIATFMVHWIKGDPMMNPASLWFGAVFNGIKQSGIGVGTAAVDVVRGRGAEYNSTLEIRRNLKPLQALWQLFTKAGRATLPVNADGKIPTSVKIEKFIEGTGGWTAEAMFRALYFTDKPFKDGAREAGAYRLFAEQGGKTSAEFRKFMANLTTVQKQKIQDYAEEATFSNERFLSKKADQGMKYLVQIVNAAAEYAPNESTRYAFQALGKTLLKANIPFVRVPSNLIQYLMELALPPLALGASYSYAKRGDVRKSAQLFTRAMMGFSLYYLGNILYDAGVIIASGEDDDENEKQIKHEVARPSSINVSALKRLMAGENPEFKVGDDIRDITKFGLPGLFFAYNAEWNETIRREKRKSRAEVSYWDQALQAGGSGFKTSLELPFLQGSFVALKAMSKGDFSNYIPELANTLSAIIIPNQFTATFTRPRADYILRADDKKAMNELFEKQSLKIFPNLKGNITAVYPIISMFGEPVDQTPKGENPYMYHLFDITNNEHIQDPTALEVFNLWRKTGELAISVPTERVKLDGVNYTLTEQDYTYLQMLAGKYKRFDIGYEMDQPAWKTMTDAERVELIDEINTDANKDAREHLLDMLYEGIDTGRIIVDPEMGTYKYMSPSEFDFDYAKKVLEEQTKPLP
jgi:hypothetical protein